MNQKRDLIELRRSRLSQPTTIVDSSPFPWSKNPEEYSYRLIQMRGVFDLSKEMQVGPRPGRINSDPGYLVVTPLRLEDGSSVLVNRGHCPLKFCNPATRNEIPEWVTIRGVLDPGEMPTKFVSWKRLRNRPHDGKFVFMSPCDLGQVAGSRNVEECKLMVLNALDYFHDEDKGLLPMQRRARIHPFQMRSKEDYMLFWADEHTHFNYAIQWFLMSALALAMTLFKFAEVTRWKY